jgi:Dyp-type peroxidase family
MIPHQPAREAPAVPLFHSAHPSPCQPAVPDEPLLNVRNIQGNILAGFNKDYQTLIFLQITNVPQFREWLEALTPFVATSAEVLAFNRLFKEIRKRRGDSRTVQATWMNLAFSYRGLYKLAPREAGKFTDPAFREGLHRRSRHLGDPTHGEGSPATWVVGGTEEDEADLVLIFAADDRDDLFAEVERIEDSIYAARTPDGRPIRCGVRILHKQHGAVLPQPLTGHEHFGFLDGVSQPGLRGRISHEDHDVLTPRQNPNNPDQGKPGQDLLWPGEFVFGYPGQDPNAENITVKGPNSLCPNGTPVAPDWAQDGSYFVFRRLRQDVPGFHHFLNEKGHELGLGAGLFGAKVVGRWKSGAPILRAPHHDDPAIAGDDCVNNDFEFHKEDENGEAATVHAHAEPASCLCPADTPPAEPDDVGTTCPFAAHIRKAYPRNDEGTLDPGIGEVNTQTHRLLRRGIPFGPPFPPNPAPDLKDSGDRGLLFMAYQTSIEDQFEFVQTQWANNPEFKDKSENGELRSGFDLIIGQNGEGNRERTFVLPHEGPDGTVHRHMIKAEKDWVIPTGGGYFFAPSISALKQLAEEES